MARVQKPRKPRSKFKLWMLVPALLLVLLVGWVLLVSNKVEAPFDQRAEQTEELPEKPSYIAPNLQKSIEAWASRQLANYHIQVYDLQADKVIGEHEPDTALFAASLYKIYVSYLALKDFQDGTQNPDDILIAGQTKKQCVDKMIRSSDSPCGEAMMAEIGQATLNQRVRDELGTTGTTFSGIQTSASDCVKVLKAIAQQSDLTKENTSFLLNAMLTQDARFKRGLQAGAPSAVWQTKVGWNENINYHDIGIMTLPDGRKFAVAILGQGSGSSAPIADFSRTIYAALTK